MINQNPGMKQRYFIILLLLLTGITKIYAQAPTVTSFSPARGPVGTLVTIDGSGFSAIADSNVVNFGATHATVTTATATQLSVIVPVGATYKPFTISNKVTRLIGHSTLPFNTTYSPASTDVEAPLRLLPDTGASDVILGDIDGDGKTDIIAINPTLQTLMIFRNISSSGTIDSKSFAPPVIYPTGLQAGFVAIDDIDGDGRLDIVLINGSYSYALNGYNTLTLLLNQSTPGHIQLSAASVPVNPAMPGGGSFLKLLPGNNCVRIADFDGDGKPDLAVLNNAGYISIYRNIYGAGSSAILAAPVTFAVGAGPISMVIGDLDGDGRPDIVTTNYTGASMTVLRNASAAGGFTAASFQRTDFSLGYTPLAASLADVDGDGKLDVIIGRTNNSAATLIHNTSTPGHFTGSSISLPNVNITSNFNGDIVAQDINGDGKPDLLTLSADLSSVYLYTNISVPGQTGTGYFNAKISYAINTIADCIGDLDGDGLPDAVVGSRFGIDIYRGKPTPVQAALIQAVSQDSLVFHPALSPNNDGIDDVFAIDNIQKFPENKLTIVNLSGNKVYEASGYGSSGKIFDGHSSITGAMQKQGTYFYLLQYTDAGQVKNKTGYIILKY
jgi:gliding motility-associated-like protein